MKKFMVSSLALAGLSQVDAKPNPIRRVVTLLQEMQKEISTEIEKEKDMYEKFQCYCKKNSGSLDAKTKEAAALIKKTKAEVEGLTGEKKQLTEELKQHKADRKKAEADLKSATKKRAEEKSKFDEATKEQRKTLSDLEKAITALEKGMGKAFLQTGAAKYLKQVAESSAVQGLDLASQEQLNSFLQSGADYSSSSGEIVGILKMIKENIDNELGGVISTEEAAVKAFTQMKASLEELISTSSQSIEKKQELKGNVAVKIVEGKNKISTTEKQLGDDLKTAAELKEACGDKGTEFETRQNDAAAEVEAIGQAIGVLNNDDALDLFKKTDTKAFTQLSLLQISSPVATALKSLNAGGHKNPAVALLAFSAEQALKAKAGKVDFSKVVKMIDDMAVLLKQEAEDDLKARDGCNESFNESEAESKEVAHAIKGLNAEIEDAASVIDAQTTAIEKYTNDIAAAKTAMSEASAQRQKENAEFIEAVELNKEAVELIMKAKDKLNAYYNPDLVRKEEIVRDETGEEAAARVSASLAQLPEGAPEIFSGERKNKGQKGGSVLALMDTLANDLNKDTQAMEHSEQTAQRDYEKLSQDLATQVADSSKAKNEASKTKADAEGEKQTLESTLEMKSEEQADIAQTIADLHAKCDFILSAFEERKAARENEISGLQKAKAVLQGAKLD